MAKKDNSTIKYVGSLILKALSSPRLQNLLLSLLKKRLVEGFIVSVLKLGGFKLWIAKILTEKVIEEADEHIIEPMFQKIGYQGDKLAGSHLYIKFENEEDRQAWFNLTANV